MVQRCSHEVYPNRVFTRMGWDRVRVAVVAVVAVIAAASASDFAITRVRGRGF